MRLILEDSHNLFMVTANIGASVSWHHNIIHDTDMAQPAKTL